MRERNSTTGRRWRHCSGALALALTVVVVACSDDSGSSPEAGLSADAVITYEFRDSSVPPEYHRSYTLTVRRDEVHVVVDSYGDVIGETTEPLPEDVWDGLVAGFDDVATIESVDSDCTGGTGRALRVTEGDEVVVDFSLSPCQGEGEAEADEVDSYVEPVIDTIPAWDRLFE
jgi:hypothetical protein